MDRRAFLRLTSATAAASALYPLSNQPLLQNRKFTMSLNPGAIGVSATLNELINYAADFGFEAFSPPTEVIAQLSDSKLAGVLERMKTHNLAWGSAGLPVDFRKDQATFEAGLKALPVIAKRLQQAGITRMNTWIMPRHDSLTYMENFKQHANRLRDIGTVLGDHNIRFGLEYVGPLTLRTKWKYTFVHSLKETRELLAEIDLPNVGLVLDSFHWYTAHETIDDLLTVKNEEVVACDLNDVPVGRTRDEQIDGQRMLPMATGMIDIKGFLNALVEMGYDGPVRAEPFNRELNDMPNEAAVSATSTAMHAAFELI